MVIDMHTHLWVGLFEQNRAEIRRAMELYGIDRVYVSGLNNALPDEEQVEELNREVRIFMDQEPGRVRGYVYVNPCNPNAADVVRRWIEDGGMDGIKLWISALCDAPCVYPVTELAIGYGVPILVHAYHKATGQLPNESVGRHVANLARRYPEAKLIMAHLGGNCYDGLPAVRDCPNVWVDQSGSVFRGDDMAYAMEMVGCDRILHGSDMPGPYLVNLGQVLACAEGEERQKILHQNAERIFDRTFRPPGRAKQ